VIKQLAKRGYGYGSGVLCPTQNRFLVNIPKNASSYLLDWASQHGWTNAIAGDSCNWEKVEEVIVVLRDPVQRWISGVGQYLTSYVLNVTDAYSWETGPGPDDQQISGDEFIANYNPVVERLLFDNLSRFDDHVWPQHEFFENLLPNVSRKFFYIDQDFDNSIGNYLNFTPLNNLDKNSADSNPETFKIQNFIRQRLNTRPELKQRVIDAYARDYELIQQVCQK
jgi:hypothetical protein